MTKIVVIEEDLAMQALLLEWLDSAGYVVESCDLAHIPTKTALIVASVMNLRGLGAIELKALRRRFPGIPVVALSGQLGRSLSRRSETAMSLGVDALLAKPLSSTELLDAVSKALGHAH